MKSFRVALIGRLSDGRKVWDFEGVGLKKFQGLSRRWEVGATREADCDFLPTHWGLSHKGALL
jgi:hypothetical protein